MAEFPAFPLWTDAYLADTTHLSTMEHGAYLLLLIAMWRTREKSLPNDDARLAKLARVTPGQWRKLKPVLMEFFQSGNDSITQARLTDEATAVKRKSKRQSDKAKTRWLKNNDSDNAAALPGIAPADADAVPDGSQTDASLTLTPIENNLQQQSTTTPREPAAAEPDYRKVGDEVVFRMGSDPSRFMGGYGDVQVWLGWGADPERDIYPTVELIAKRPGWSPPSSLNYFSKPIRSAIEKRRAGEADGPNRTDDTDWHGTWKVRFKHFRANHKWPDGWGDQPTADDLATKTDSELAAERVAVTGRAA